MPENMDVAIRSGFITCEPSLGKTTCEITIIEPKHAASKFTGVTLLDISQGTEMDARYSGLGFFCHDQECHVQRGTPERGHDANTL